MYSIFPLALLPLPLSASALLPRQFTLTPPFVLRASQPGSPIHLSSLNANVGRFWLGKPASSSCPTELRPNCPTGNETALLISADGYAVLNADVPSGQFVYVAKDGALSFTKALHVDVAAIAYPKGFQYDDATGGLASFTFDDTPSKGWLACPVMVGGPWLVYADIRGQDGEGCLGFEARAERYAGGRVWEYD